VGTGVDQQRSEAAQARKPTAVRLGWISAFVVMMVRVGPRSTHGLNTAAAAGRGAPYRRSFRLPPCR